MLARITGNGVREEARSATTSHDIVRSIRKRRLKWLGIILRGDSDRLIFNAVEVQKRAGLPGGLFMDTPQHLSLEELVTLARCKKSWAALIAGIP